MSWMILTLGTGKPWLPNQDLMDRAGPFEKSREGVINGLSGGWKDRQEDGMHEQDSWHPGRVRS